MRLVQVTVPTGERDAVLATLDEEEIDYVVSEESSGREFEALVWFPLPTKAVEPVLDSLREAGLDPDAYTVVLDAQTVVSRRFDELVERYEEEANEDRIAREELRARATELAPAVPSYLSLTAISAAIATAGLLLDSPAVVVGSMVIAPLVGPALTASVGTVLDDSEMFGRGVRLQALGFAAVIVTAAVFAFTLKTLNLVPPGLDIVAIDEIRERIAPDFLSLAVALGAGIAGALSLRSGVSASLVGVMIAVALVPPAATVGIGIAWGLPAVALGAAVLALVNGLSINLAALGTFWYSGYRPERWFRLDAARSRALKRAGVLVVAIVLLSAVLGGVTYASYRAATFEQDARAVTAGVLANETAAETDEFSLIAIDVSYADPLPLPNRPAHVTVTVGQRVNGPPPDLADRVAARLGAVRPGPVTVEVRYVRIDRSSNGATATAAMRTGS